jgi:hypothetical protein
MYICHMHRIPVRLPPLFASGRRSRSRRRGQRAFASGPGASPCAGGAYQRRPSGQGRRNRSNDKSSRTGARSSRAGCGAGAGGAGGVGDGQVNFCSFISIQKPPSPMLSYIYEFLQLAMGLRSMIRNATRSTISPSRVQWYDAVFIHGVVG